MNARTIILLALIMCLIGCSGQDRVEDRFVSVMGLKKVQAESHRQRGEYNKAVSLLESLIQSPLFDRYEMEQVGIYYDLACNYALLGFNERALNYLEKAVECGYGDVHHLEGDDDLKRLRSERRYLQLVTQLKREESFWENSYLNTPYRANISENEKIAGLSKLWSEIKYNFINFDLVPEANPDRLYMEYLSKVRQTESTLAYYRVLQNFCVHLKDGHTDVDFPKELQQHVRGRVPIQTRLVEGRVIITRVYDNGLEKKGLAPGVEITHVDGHEAKTYADRFIRPFGTTNSEHGRNRYLFEYAFLRGPVGRPVVITCQDPAGKIFAVALPRLKRIPGKWQPVVFRRLENNIGYLNIRSFYADEIVTRVDAVFSEIMDTDALIIDLRDNGGGNGRVGWKILGYFTDRPFRIFKWKTRMYLPIWRARGRRERIYVKKPAQKLANKNKYYPRPVALLTRDRTASMAENFCLVFKMMKRGKIIGGSTMGSSGTPLFFSLPGGGTGKVVTTRSLYPDDTEFTGTGVQPDIEVYPTIEDFRSGRDRILERAVRYLNKKMGK